MKPGLFWVCVSVFIVLVLVLSSCGQTAPQEIVAPTTVQGTVKQTVIPATTAQQSTLTPPTATTSSVEMPKYGGISTILWNADALNFDDAFASNQGCYSLLLTNEELWSGDWSKGPAGTGEATWASPGIEAYPAKFQVGILCDSWEVAGTESDTLIFHIRKGVNWQNKPPTNGRELTADDVLFSLKRAWTIPTATVGKMYKPPLSLTAPDKYTVVIQYNQSEQSVIFNQYCPETRLRNMVTCEIGETRLEQVHSY
jgi:ABC-type transport system substrate-binding protein